MHDTAIDMGNSFAFLGEFVPKRLYYGVVHPNKCPSNTKKEDFLYFKFNTRRIGLYFGPPHLGLIYKYIKELNRALRKNPKKAIIHVAFSTENKTATNSAVLIGAYAILELRMEPMDVVQILTANDIFL